MRILDLGKHRKARIWLGTLPDALFSPNGTIQHAIPVCRQPQVGPRFAAIELLVPLGPRFMYGLLGGDFTADVSNRFQVEVCTSLDDGPHFPNSLAKQIDETRVGFPEEYAPSVSLGVDLAKSELKELKAGKLRINCSVHGLAGSSIAINKHLLAALVKLFNRPNLDDSDDKLISLFPDIFS